MLNSPQREVIQSSVKELEYHAALLEALRVDNSQKIVIHLRPHLQRQSGSLSASFKLAKGSTPGSRRGS
jgi:UV DNA damage repair endonuclease